MKAKEIALQFLGISISIFVLVVICIELYRVSGYCYDFGYRVFTEPAMDKAPGKTIEVRISDEMSEYDIAVMLEEKHLIRDAKLFFVQTKLSNYSKKIKAGKYSLNTSLTANEMLEIMAQEQEEASEEESEETKEEEITINGEIRGEEEASQEAETEGGNP